MRTTSRCLILLLTVLGCSSAESTQGPTPTSDAATVDGSSDGGSEAGATEDSGTEAGPEDGASEASPEDAQPDALAQDVVQDVTQDAQEDAAQDASLDVVVDSPDPSDGSGDASMQDAEAGSGDVLVRVTSGNDALASYLMSSSPPGWNIFSGATVPVGRHFDVGNVSYYTAFRFVGVAIPKGSTIESARLRFYPTNEVDSSKSLWLNVYAERAANSAPFDPSNYVTGRPDQRLRTTTFIDHWLVRCNGTCTDLTEWDCPQRKLDCWNRDVLFEVPKELAAIVQEVIDLPGWEPGHAITILLINSATDADGANYKGSRSITGFDPARGAQFAPQLAIAFTSG
jgi:hypothetical protein